jgi:uridine kinase
VTGTDRADTIARLADMVCAGHLGHPTRVAIDGVTASGKSTLAAELVRAVGRLERPVVHLTMDGYHHPRAQRYRQGRLSALGYYEDAYDFDAFARHVLIPLGPGGNRRYRRQIIDLATDEPRHQPLLEAPVDAVVVVDGSFLQGPELRAHWDHRIYIDTDLDVARARGVARDSSLLGGPEQARRLYDVRYHAAARLYLKAVDPARCASVVVDNNDLDAPRLHSPG